jgi:hypothetical protein
MKAQTSAVLSSARPGKAILHEPQEGADRCLDTGFDPATLPDEAKYGYSGVVLWQMTSQGEQAADETTTSVTSAAGAGATSRDAAGRTPNALPSYMAQVLMEFGLMSCFNALPSYEQAGYVLWVTSAYREETRAQRLAEMLDELYTRDLPECVSISSDWSR